MPNLEMIRKIAEYFDVPIDYIVNEDDTPIIPYVNCTVQFLNNDRYIQYEPETEYDTDHLKDTETIFDILGILNHCADTDSYP